MLPLPLTQWGNHPRSQERHPPGPPARPGCVVHPIPTTTRANQPRAVDNPGPGVHRKTWRAPGPRARRQSNLTFGGPARSREDGIPQILAGRSARSCQPPHSFSEWPFPLLHLFSATRITESTHLKTRGFLRSFRILQDGPETGHRLEPAPGGPAGGAPDGGTSGRTMPRLPRLPRQAVPPASDAPCPVPC